MNFLLSFLYGSVLLVVSNDSSLPIACTPVVSLSSVSSELLSLKVNQVDTIQVRIKCFAMCKPVLESPDFEIQSLDSGRFVVKPRKSGPAKIQILSDCPPNTSVEMGGKLQNVSGRMTVDIMSLSVSK